MSNQKVLIVTDYSGNLHITPVGNKAFYQSRNKIVKDKQYKFREGMTEEEAMDFVKKNNGKDPNHISLSKAEQTIKDQAAEIEELKKQLAEKQNGGSVDTGVGGDKKKLVKDIIAEIEAAPDAGTVNKLIEGEERESVLKAATKKLASFN